MFFIWVLLKDKELWSWSWIAPGIEGTWQADSKDGPGCGIQGFILGLKLGLYVLGGRLIQKLGMAVGYSEGFITFYFPFYLSKLDTFDFQLYFQLSRN